jgi:hypothetical protein
LTEPGYQLQHELAASNAKLIDDDCPEPKDDDQSSELGDPGPSREFNLGLKACDDLVISSNGKNKVLASASESHLTIPDYPAVSKDGILHIIELTKSPLDINMEDPWNQVKTDKDIAHHAFAEITSKIQFSTQKTSTPRSITLKLLCTHARDPDALAWHRQYKCHGIHHCDSTHPDIITLNDRYDRVNPEIF